MSVVVVYDQGAVSPLEIIGAIDPACPFIAVLAPSDHARRIRPLFSEVCAAVYDLDDVRIASRLRGHKPMGIVTFSEPMLRATSALAAELRLPFHDAQTVRLLTDKEAQRRRLREAGVDSTASVVLSDAAAWDAAARRMNLPLVVKPVQGVSSRNTILVEDREAGFAQVGQVLRDEGRVLVEEYLSGIEVDAPFGDYVSVETAVCRGERSHFAVTGKLRLAPPFRESGQFWPPRLDEPTAQAVLLLADHAAKALEVQSGILHTEIKLTPDGPRIIEVNGRIGGYVAELALRAAGVDLVDVGARIACGERVDVPPIDLDRIFFQFTTPAPTESGTVSAVCGRDLAGIVPGVTRYSPLIRPGAEVGGFQTRDLDLVVGEVSDHEALAATIENIMDSIVYQFEIGGRKTTRSARDLVNNP